MPTPHPQRIPRGRVRVIAVFLAGVLLSLVAFFFARELSRREIEGQFRAAAQDRAQSVVQGLRSSFQEVLILRSFYEASDDVTRGDFDDFLAPLLADRPAIQAFQWLPEVNPGNRKALEAEGRRHHPGFRFFTRSASGVLEELPPDATFYGIQYVMPLAGNEVTLGYAAQGLATRQETLRAALSSGALLASGRIRLIQETGDQAGVLVMAAVRRKDGRPYGVVQGVFRMGDLVHKSQEVLAPEGVVVRLFEGTVPVAEALVHEEPSPLPFRAPEHAQGLRLTQTVRVAGRAWTVAVTPAGGYFERGTPGRAWAVLGLGLAFSLVLAGYVRALQRRESDIRRQVDLRTRELAEEMDSHRKDAQALRESEARFRYLIEEMGEGMWVLNPEGVTTFVNRRMAEMLGYSPQELVGRPMFDFMGPEEVEQARRNLAERRLGKASQHDFRFRRRDGSELWTIVTGTPVLDEEGRVVSVLGMITDITERRRQEDAQLQSQKLESLGILAGGIAHDFNNLLTAILGNISLAQLCLPKLSPAWTYFENMERAVQRATNLTRQLLAYSGKGRFTVGPVDLNQAVQEMSHLLSVSISKKVALRFFLQEGLPPLEAEASQLQQVVMNLVTNASEAIGENEGIVSVRTGIQTYTQEDLDRDFPGQPPRPGTFLTLEVADTGQGMTPEVMARIFEPFFTTKFTGRGLGLSAMQGIVRGHRGGIRVYSEPGKGTTFKLIFPAGEGAVLPEAPAVEAGAWTGQGLVLVVDDEAGVRQVAAGILESTGFQVVGAEDGLAALARYQESPTPIRLVLMDLTMPHLDGVETFRELRRIDPECRVVLMSGYNEQDAIQEFLGKGLAAFIQKPFQRDELLRVVRQALGS